MENERKRKNDEERRIKNTWTQTKYSSRFLILTSTLYAAIRASINLKLLVTFNVHSHVDPCTDGNFITISSKMALKKPNLYVEKCNAPKSTQPHRWRVGKWTYTQRVKLN